MRLAAMGLGLAVLFPQVQGSAQSIPMEPNLFGIPVIKVHLLRDDGTSKEVRMVVDTGSEITTLDRSIGPDFWTRDVELEGKRSKPSQPEDRPYLQNPSGSINSNAVPCRPALPRRFCST
ncbi:hypothetical protein [Geothrix fuzhouensis]|uniref:hypothetical protein n=1 Tax=Geothrix fuzhouensis TaxID=2966451 RepID=UPI0021486D69|nr:hypothetical protein [Geothrix fuzhouensis]